MKLPMYGTASHVWVGALLSLLLLAAGLRCACAGDSRLSLNGQWEARAAGLAEDLPADTPDAAAWLQVTVPSRTWPTPELNGAPAVWARRSVEVPEALAGEDVVLHWGRVLWGATAWVNGVRVGDSPVTCPHDVLLPAGLVRPGANTIVLRVGGWSAVPRRDGIPLTPGGFPNFGNPHNSALFGDLWLDFYRAAHLSHVLMMPDVAGGKVTVRAWVDSVRPLSGEATLSAQITAWEPGGAAGEALGAAEMRLNLDGAPGPFDLTVPVPNAKPWSPESPNLCLAHIELRTGEQLAHQQDVRFGQRELKIVGGHYEFNGERFFMRGENSMWQWSWSDAWYADAAKIQHYLVDFERGMNSKGLRTHTSPPADSWLDIADEQGMLFLSEFPMCQNYGRWPFTPEDWEVYKRNALLEAEGWVRYQCNRPSVILWVPTNEFSAQANWQTTELYGLIKGLDPTRPVMRASEPTPDVVDIHCYSGYWNGCEGDFYQIINGRAASRDPRRPLGNSEYIENWNPARQLRWNGRPGNDREAMLVYAEFISEQTEAMRRLQYDLILPYGSSGRSDEANTTTPNYHALRSGLAPVAVSIDLFDRNFIAGRELATDVCLINDTPEPQPVSVDCTITRESPEYLLNAEFAAQPLFTQRLTAQVAPSSVERRLVKWPLPVQEGAYYLSAVLTAAGKPPVVSQRVVHVLAPNAADPSLRDTPTLVLGADPQLRTWMAAQGVRFVEPDGVGVDTPLRVLVWDGAAVTAQQRALAPRILGRVNEGGRLIIAANGKWDWPQLADFTVGQARCSRAFWCEGVQAPAGLDGEYLRRWNGLPGVVANGAIQGPAVRQGRQLLWIEKPDTVAVVDVPQGTGHVVISQLAIHGRLDPTSPAYDPVAERFLLYLLQG